MVKVTINENLCKGCGLCVRACPKGVLALAKDKTQRKGLSSRPSSRIRRPASAALPVRVLADVVISIVRD